MCAIDCSRGGAQKAFRELRADFARAGWELQGDAKYDSQFMRRGLIRWQICITGQSFRAGLLFKPDAGVLNLCGENGSRAPPDGGRGGKGD
jgi:hypothetical protein